MNVLSLTGAPASCPFEDVPSLWYVGHDRVALGCAPVRVPDPEDGRVSAVQSLLTMTLARKSVSRVTVLASVL